AGIRARRRAGGADHARGASHPRRAGRLPSTHGRALEDAPHPRDGEAARLPAPLLAALHRAQAPPALVKAWFQPTRGRSTSCGPTRATGTYAASIQLASAG